MWQKMEYSIQVQIPTEVLLPLPGMGKISGLIVLSNPDRGQTISENENSESKLSILRTVMVIQFTDEGSRGKAWSPKSNVRLL